MNSADLRHKAEGLAQTKGKLLGGDSTQRERSVTDLPAHTNTADGHKHTLAKVIDANRKMTHEDTCEKLAAMQVHKAHK